MRSYRSSIANSFSTLHQDLDDPIENADEQPPAGARPARGGRKAAQPQREMLRSKNPKPLTVMPSPGMFPVARLLVVSNGGHVHTAEPRWCRMCSKLERCYAAETYPKAKP